MLVCSFILLLGIFWVILVVFNIIWYELKLLKFVGIDFLYFCKDGMLCFIRFLNSILCIVYICDVIILFIEVVFVLNFLVRFKSGVFMVSFIRDINSWLFCEMNEGVYLLMYFMGNFFIIVLMVLNMFGWRFVYISICIII